MYYYYFSRISIRVCSIKATRRVNSVTELKLRNKSVQFSLFLKNSNLISSNNKTIFYMTSFLWIINSIFLILAIIIHNPKSQGIGSPNQLFVSTRSAEANLNKITWLLIVLFFSLATYMAIVSKLE